MADAPRELIRFEQPFANHNGGHLTFNPLAAPGERRFRPALHGLRRRRQRRRSAEASRRTSSSAFGKILRIDPLGTNSANGKYGIPAEQPVRQRRQRRHARRNLRLRRAQSAAAFLGSEERQHVHVATSARTPWRRSVPVTAGANLGWNDWEGSFAFVSRSGVRLANPRGDPEDHLSRRRVRADGSAASAKLRRHRRLRLPRRTRSRS